jgi:hypothetical protein
VNFVTATSVSKSNHRRSKTNSSLKQEMYVTGAGYDELSPIFDRLRHGVEAEFLLELL